MDNHAKRRGKTAKNCKKLTISETSLGFDQQSQRLEKWKKVKSENPSFVKLRPRLSPFGGRSWLPAAFASAVQLRL
jgi:hypothetical protein